MAVTQPDPFIGHEIDGYLIEKLLGKGGMARVYRAQDVRIGRYLAVKVIEPKARDDQEYTRRFEKEARAVAQLQHPNIVSLYRFGQVSGLYYMAIQYIDGVDLGWVLSDYARDQEIMPYEEILRVVTQIGSALDYAHSKGVIHRDVKPANVMLDREGTAILTDFGLALVQVEGTRGEIFGTPHYIAPEQAVNSAGAVAQSDQYSLGVMLYQMLTGTLPYDAPTPMDVAMAHMTESFPSPLERNPDLHPAFVPILEKVMQKEPQDRYESCAALAEDLRQAIAKQARRPSSAVRVSMADISHQVQAFRQANPLPPLPAVVAPPAAPVAKVSAEIPAVTRPASGRGLASTLIRPTNQQQIWLWVGVMSAVVVLIGIIVIAVLVLKKSATPGVPLTPSVVATVEQGLPAATATLAVMATVDQALPAATATFAPYRLVIGTYKGNLFVINLAEAPFHLAPLQLGDGSSALRGSDWGIDVLQKGECVTVWKDEKNSESAGMTCTQVGSRLVRPKNARFWESAFNVYYNESLIGPCDSKGCVVHD
jgi:tRNA A-37 threonylcarbamoyl transferase component Bud32